MVFLKESFKKNDFEENQQMTKSMKNFPVGKELKACFENVNFASCVIIW